MKIHAVNVGVPVEILNKHLPNISSERYHYTNLTGRQRILLVEIQCKAARVEWCTPVENSLSKLFIAILHISLALMLIYCCIDTHSSVSDTVEFS
jgi:hypothetical protein